MATNSTSPGGTISVPISSILEAFGGELSEAERTTLFQKLIGFRVNEVQPGDLIRAALFNQMLGDINDLAIRVAKLEAGIDTRPKRPVITQILPQVVRTGTEFTVFGENLDPSLLNRIDIDDTGVPLPSLKAGSGPNQLVLDAPAVMGLPPGGRTVILAVSNAAGTARGTYSQLPGVSAQLQANVASSLKRVIPDEAIQPGKPYDFEFELEIHSSLDEQFVLEPRISGQGWSVVVKGSDRINATAASATAGLKVTKAVTVTTGSSESAALVLSLRGTSFPTFNATLQPITTITIGLVQEIPTDKIRFINTTPFGSSAKYQSGILSIRKNPTGGAPAPIVFQTTVQLHDAGTYLVGAPIPSAGWTVTLSTQPTIITNTKNVGSQIKFSIAAPAPSGPAQGQFSFTVSSNDGQLQQTFTAQLQVVDSLPQ